MRRACFALLIFFIFSCSPKSSWKLQQDLTGSLQYNSGRIILPPDDLVNGLEIELQRSPQGMRLTINIFSREIPPSPDHSNKAVVQMLTGKGKSRFLAHRLEGGQSLLLTPEDTQTVIDALYNKENMTIILAGFKRHITADNFPSLFDKLKDIPVSTTGS